MKIKWLYIILCFAIYSFHSQALANNTEYVDPFIGADGEGNVFPGVCVPLGMVKLGPDCGNKDWNAGWDPDGNINGFSHTHVSGTGGGSKYGNILMMPMTGELNLSDYSSPRSAEQSVIGCYSVQLDKYHIKARLSALDKCGFHEYTFPQNDDSKIIIDLGSFLQSHGVESQEFVGSEVRIISDTEIEGYSRIRGGWNMGAAYTVYFYAKFDTPADKMGTWKANVIYHNTLYQPDTNEKTGAFFSFKTKQGQKVCAKVGISYLGIEKAKMNSNEADSWAFEDIQKLAIDKWNAILDKIDITAADEQKKIFYTALYHSYLQPINKTGENSRWKSDAPYYDDYYAIWDTFRVTHPLFTLLTPSIQTDMIRSLIDIYIHEGYMPDARSGDDNGRVQGGTNCDILIADAIVKGLTGIDYNTALNSMIHNAEIPSGGDERKEGRGGLLDYNKLGYVSTDYERAGSRTFEYAYCDFAIATVAGILGKKDIADKYLKRSSNWENLWNPNIESLGFSGFLWPKNNDGTWWPEDNFSVFSGGTWPNFFYETFSWEMSFYVPHDINKLIEKCGGKEMFQKRLDTYFSYDKVDQRWHIGLFQVANEPGFLVPTYYNYINRPDKTAEIVRKVLSTRYDSSRSGLPGNDDSGSMSSWYIFHALGFYPNAGQNVYLISSPMYEKATIYLENGKIFTIEAKNANTDNIYVQEAFLNGKKLENTWIQHQDIVNGGTLEFIMGNKPSKWGYSSEVPPSLSLQ